MNEKTELLPCPFCGDTGEPTTEPGFGTTRHTIYCTTCLSSGPVTYREQDAPSRWNERAASPSSKSTKEADSAWLNRIRETAAGLRDNSIRLAKYPGMADEARARELAALYIAEIADLHEAEMRVMTLASSSIKEDGERAEQARRYLWLLDSPTPWHVRVQQLRTWCDEYCAVVPDASGVVLPSPPSPLGDTPAAVRKCLYCERDMLADSECLSKAQSESCGMRAPLGDTPDQQEQKR